MSEDIEIKKGVNETQETMENKKLFDDDTLNNSVSQDFPTAAKEEDFHFGDFSDGQEYKVKLDDDEKDITEKEYEDADGNKIVVKFLNRPLTINYAKGLHPIVKDAEGKIIPALVTNNGKKYYASKLNVLYDGSKYKSLIPHIRWWVNGSKAKPTFETEYKEPVNLKYKTDITKLYWKYCDAFGFDKTQKDEKRILTPQKFIEGLVGKKVKIKEVPTLYKGEWRYKLSIDSFIKE